MKTKLSMLVFISAAFFAIFLTSCVDIEGPPGPSGKDASYFVKTLYYDIKPSDWIKSEEDGVWYDVRESDYVNWNIVDNGAVLFYLKSLNNDTWLLLPSTQIVRENDTLVYSTEYEPWYGVGELIIQWRDTHPTNPLPPDWTCTIKVVIIEGEPGKIQELKSLDPNDQQAIDTWLRHEIGNFE